jgi:hypothetical protein
MPAALFAAGIFNLLGYAAFFSAALAFAHRARCAAAIFLRAASDILCLAGVLAIGFANTKNVRPG